MTAGQKYIKENFIKELPYKDALNVAIKEFKAIGIVSLDTLYNSEGSYLDSPIYPANAELYDEFVDELGFDEDEFANYCVRMMERKDR